MLVLAAVWTTHQWTIRAHGAFYTYEELALFVASAVAGVLLAIQCWGLAAKKFIAGWASAAVIATILLTTFDWFLFSATSGAPWAIQASSLVMTSLLAVLTVYAPIFLALFAGAAWISHRLSIWHFGIFALAGSTAMITPYVVWGIDIDSFAMAWWPFRAKDVALGAIAGVTFWYVAHPTKSAPRVAA
jgi:hypothetical protein